jgi:hypothetical protein
MSLINKTLLAKDGAPLTSHADSLSDDQLCDISGGTEAPPAPPRNTFAEEHGTEAPEDFNCKL